MVKKVGLVFLLIILFTSLFFNFFFYQKINSLKKSPNFQKVIEVIDGDTIKLETTQIIRLANLYAPELQYCYGEKAKKRLEQLVLNKNIDFEPTGKDNFKRTIALVYQDGILVNEIILKEGLARYDGSPSSKREILKNAYDFAFKNKVGIFKDCVVDTPPEKNCLIKGNIDRHNNKIKHYFLPDCHEYKQVIVEKDLGEDWFCTEKEAIKAGFTKASNCP